MLVISLSIAAYLIGSIPVGVIVARSKGIDLFSVGSGNIGATNVKRALGSKWGYAVFVLDILKGLVPSLAALLTVPERPMEMAVLVGACAILGHCASCFLKFRGGKGISTGLGVLLGSVPAVGLSAFGIFLVLLGFTRYVSLSSIAAAVSLPIWGWVYGHSPLMMALYLALAIFIVVRHRANIVRLLNGTESKFSVRGESPRPMEVARPEEPV